MAVRWWCLSYLKTSVTAFLSPWSSTSWILLTLSCRGQKVQVLMMASLSPSNSHRVSDFPQMLSVMNELILEMQSSTLTFVKRCSVLSSFHFKPVRRGFEFKLDSLANWEPFMVTALFQTWLKLQSRPSGVSNEARFVFTVQSIVMSQKLKGTLTFIVKVHTYTSHISTILT